MKNKGLLLFLVVMISGVNFLSAEKEDVESLTGWFWTIKLHKNLNNEDL